jgi:hypothetical protein
MTQITIDADTLYIPEKSYRTVRVKAWGAGGGGAGGGGVLPQAGGGDGGGGGAYVTGTVRLTKGKPVPVSIGIGGTGGGEGGRGATGTPTQITQDGLVRAASGHGGRFNPDLATYTGGIGGEVKDCHGSVSYPGFYGTRGTWSLPGGNGGNGGDGVNAFPEGNGGRGAGSAGVSPPYDAEAGAVPGGGGGGGDARQTFTLSVTGFGASINASTHVSVYSTFNQEVVADWHSLVSAEVPEQLVGASFACAIDSTGAYPNTGYFLFVTVSNSGDAIHLQGYIQTGLATTITGRVYCDDAFGQHSNEAGWSVSLVGA